MIFKKLHLRGSLFEGLDLVILSCGATLCDMICTAYLRVSQKVTVPF